MIRRFAPSLLLVLSLAALVVAPAVDAKPKTKKFGSTITIASAGASSNFSGKVGSKAARCVRGREVTLFAKPNGGDYREAGTDTTDAEGRYEIDQLVLPGVRYYASVARKAKRNTVCLGARSTSIGS